MAKLTMIDGESREVQDGEKVHQPAEELGVQFGCEDGVCGTCIVEVEEGAENFEPLTDKEKEMGLEPAQRLCCQAKIKSGEVKFRY
jgi:ferredoxin